MALVEDGTVARPAVTLGTTSDWTVVLPLRVRVTVAAQAVGMKACLCAELEVRTLATMAAEAGIEPGAVGVIVVALDTTHDPVLFMREIRGEMKRALHHRLAQRPTDAARQQRTERDTD